jgi:hypothetical protein
MRAISAIASGVVEESALSAAVPASAPANSCRQRRADKDALTIWKAFEDNGVHNSPAALSRIIYSACLGVISKVANLQYLGSHQIQTRRVDDITRSNDFCRPAMRWQTLSLSMELTSKPSIMTAPFVAAISAKCHGQLIGASDAVSLCVKRCFYVRNEC